MTEIQMKESEELQSRAAVSQESEILRCAQNDKGTRGPQAHPTDGARPRRPWHTSNTEMDVVDELKTVAISRLVLDNIEHIKSFWPMLGVQTAQMALCFGADDLDGTVREYRIVEQESHVHDERGQGGEALQDYLSVEHLRGMINETGRKAVQRDGWYNPIDDA